MFTYKAKHIDEALAQAADELNVEVNELYYYVVEENESLLTKDITLNVYTILDVERFALNYIETYFDHLKVKADIKTKIMGNKVAINIECDQNPVVIGKAGSGIRAINQLTQSAIMTKFKQRFMIMIDINEYRSKRYTKLIALAKKIAYSVQKSKVTAKLDPMSSDERKMIHQALSHIENVKSVSVGSGANRHLTLVYDAKKNKKKNK